jgi:hypothetical protein
MDLNRGERGRKEKKQVQLDAWERGGGEKKKGI